MKQSNLILLLVMLLSMTSYKSFAYDIAVENTDGITIYYNYINDGKELEVTASSFNYLGYDGTFYNEYKSGVTPSKELSYSSSYTSSSRIVIPSEVVFMGRTRKVTAIGEYAFLSLEYKKKIYGKKNFSYIYIPSTINKIGKYAFAVLSVHQLEKGTASYGPSSYLYDIKTVVIEDIGNWCKIDFEDEWANPIRHSKKIYTNDENEVTNLIIPEGVTNISPYAFFNCSGIKTLTIPSSVTSIGTSAFSGCSGLTSVTIPNSVTNIGERAFSGCSGLTSVTIPHSVTNIGKSVFFNCSGLTSVTIPNSVTSIGDAAFMSCEGLTSVKIPNSVTSIGNSAFAYCSGLTSVTIPNSVTSIGNSAFAYCSGLTSVTIPNSVTSIGNSAFNCENLATVVSLIENPFEIYGKSSSYRVFSQNTFMNATLYVPTGKKEAYKATGGWKDFVFIEEGTGGGSGDEPTPGVETCAKPTISYSKGKLTFNSETEGATYHYSITDSDIKAGSGSEVQLAVTYNINVYAAKEGCENSETAIATLCWIDAEPTTDGIINNVAHVRAKAVMIQSNGNVVSVSGADKGTEISIYDIAGKKVGSSIATSDITKIATSLDSGSIAIIRIGEKAVKILIK